MSDLPTPVTRSEIFFSAAATGDASELPTPATRTEQYLKYMAENGGGGGGGGTTNYNNLSNKPKVNNVTLQGNKELEDLGLPERALTRVELANMWLD